MTDCISIEVWDEADCIARADALGAFLATLWPQDDWTGFDKKLAGRRKLAAHVALDGAGAIAGCKIGLERNRGVWESWLGGVREDLRGQGLASRLMQAQHDWAKAAGFKAVATHTRQANRAMAITNLKGGFVVCAVIAEPNEPVKIHFSKAL